MRIEVQVSEVEEEWSPGINSRVFVDTSYVGMANLSLAGPKRIQIKNNKKVSDW